MYVCQQSAKIVNDGHDNPSDEFAIITIPEIHVVYI